MAEPSPAPKPSLIDRLRTIADSIAISHVPVISEVPGIVGGLVAYAEHGEDIFTAVEQAGKAGLDALLAGKPLVDAVAAAAPAALSAEQQVSQLQAELATLRASLATQAGNAATAAETGGSAPQ